jgi:paraquat-inducible protein A
MVDMEIVGQQEHHLTARGAGLVACTACGRVHRPDHAVCTRCGAMLQSRDPLALQKVWAWWFAGLIAYLPANIYPMLLTATLGDHTESTIISGVIDLVHHGSWGIALIIFVASILIPIGKFIAIAYLAIGVKYRPALSAHRRHTLHEIVEFVGRWSMIDVFVVAILVALVQFDVVATINPGPAAASFALSVAFTMLSAQSFDARAIWDTIDEDV